MVISRVMTNIAHYYTEIACVYVEGNKGSPRIRIPKTCAERLRSPTILVPLEWRRPLTALLDGYRRQAWTFNSLEKDESADTDWTISPGEVLRRAEHEAAAADLAASIL